MDECSSVRSKVELINDQPFCICKDSYNIASEVLVYKNGNEVSYASCQANSIYCEKYDKKYLLGYQNSQDCVKCRPDYKLDNSTCIVDSSRYFDIL